MADPQGCQQGRQGVFPSMAEVWMSCQPKSTGMETDELVMLDAR